MEQLILNIKNKSKIPFLKELLKRMEFVEVVEPKKLSVKEKKILVDLDEAVDFVNKYKKGKVKAKSLNQLLDELYDHPYSAFERELKQLAKKYPSIKKDITALAQQLTQQPQMGTPLGHDCFKICMAITAKGKSGGARVITHVQVTKEHIFLLSIYDKSEAENIADKELLGRLKNL